jgi:hypothetical protein
MLRPHSSSVTISHDLNRSTRHAPHNGCYGDVSPVKPEPASCITIPAAILSENRRMKIQKAPLCSCVLTALLCLGYAQIGVRPKKDVTLKQTTDDKFRVGDVWEYQTRKGEERSRITILRVDDSLELGIIVHIGVDNIHFANCHGGPEPDAVPHMPFARKALDASVKKKLASGQPLPSYENGYQEWSDAYSQKQAGVYLVSVADAISVTEKTFQKGIGCE